MHPTDVIPMIVHQPSTLLKRDLNAIPSGIVRSMIVQEMGWKIIDLAAILRCWATESAISLREAIRSFGCGRVARESGAIVLNFLHAAAATAHFFGGF